MEQQYKIEKEKVKEKQKLRQKFNIQEKEESQFLQQEQISNNNNQDSDSFQHSQKFNNITENFQSQDKLQASENKNDIQSQNNDQKSYYNKNKQFDYQNYLNMDDLQDQQLLEHSSIYSNKNLSSTVKVVIPIILVSIFLLFVYSDSTLIGFFGYQIHYGKFLHTELKSLKEFSMIETVKEQWDAGVYPLAIMVILFSGIWPFVKIVGLFCAWFTSTKHVSYKNREKILVVLDALGKWSFFDSMLMIILIDALHMQINIPNPAFKTYIQIEMIPSIGFFAFYTATILSLIITHFEIYYHRQTINEDRLQKILDAQEKRETLMEEEINLYNQDNNSSFVKNNKDQNLNKNKDNNIQGNLTEIESQSQTLKDSEYSQIEEQSIQEENNDKQYKKKNKDRGIMIQSKKNRIIYTILLILCLCLLVSGVLVKSISFEILGLVGILLNPEQAHQSYSILDIGIQMNKNSYHSFMILVVQMVFYFTNIIIPILFLLLLLILFIIPEKIKLKNQLKIFVWIEILYAWSSIDVIVAVVIISIIEVKQFMFFLIGDRCDELNILLEYLDQQNILKLPGGPTCFDASIYLDIGCILLFGASFFFIILGTCILRSLQGNIDSKLHVDDAIRKQSEFQQQNLSRILKYNPNIVKGEANQPLLL